tara:strand:+ start:5714 stop:6394 length:681 start_codon:yes stop_codon:yes gene_type:complete
MKKIATIFVFLTLPLVSSAANYESSFIEDLPELSESKTDKSMLEWTSETANLLDYKSLYIPQPVIILSDKNKYKGAQPNQKVMMADRVQALAKAQFGDLLKEADGVGKGTLVMNLAITEIIMKKKRRLLGFTPVGAVVHAATSNLGYEDLEKFAKKIHLEEAKLEVELVDGFTGELLAVRIIQIEGITKGSEEQSWQALRGHIERAFERFYVNYAARVEAARVEAE